MDLLTQVCNVLLWAGLIKLLQMTLWPSLRQTLGDYAYPAAYPASLLLFALATWYCGFFRIPVILALLLFILLGSGASGGDYWIPGSGAILPGTRSSSSGFSSRCRPVLIRPSTTSANKYADHAFIASIIREPVVPPLDPGLREENLTVYYLGHWLIGTLSIATGIPSESGFRLVSPVYGTAFVVLYALGLLLLDRYRWLPLAVLLIVPPSVLWSLAAGSYLPGLPGDQLDHSWCPGRVSVFSLILGNVHAFEMALFNEVFLIFLLGFIWCRWGALDTRGRFGLLSLLGLSIGSMPLLSSWDALVYAPLVAIFLLVLALRERDRSTLMAALFVPAFALASASLLLPQPASIAGSAPGFPTGPARVSRVGQFLALT